MRQKFLPLGVSRYISAGQRRSLFCVSMSKTVQKNEKQGGGKKEIDPNFWTCKKKLKMKFLYLPPLNFFFKPGVIRKPTSKLTWLMQLLSPQEKNFHSQTTAQKPPDLFEGCSTSARCVHPAAKPNQQRLPMSCCSPRPGNQWSCSMKKPFQNRNRQQQHGHVGPSQT